jgi:cytochrome c oxidase cbb3-type subunit III
MTGKKEIDELSGIDTTGHEWDGIKELNNPLPRWWLWTLYATIIWSVGYMVVYPAVPGLTSATQGLWKWSSRADLRGDLATVEQGRQAINEQIAGMDINAILANEDVRSFSVAAGASMFKVYCSQCHGAGAQGGVGFPNLNDDSWLWGGTPEQIQQTIAHGVRDATSADTRDSLMPSFGKDGILTPEQITQVANHVRKIAGLEHDATAATAGAQIFAENDTCTACHGANGEGNAEFGAPQLNDAIWLRGSETADIIAQIQLPKHGMMPGWQGRLGESRVKQLTAYVLSLGGGQ